LSIWPWARSERTSPAGAVDIEFWAGPFSTHQHIPILATAENSRNHCAKLAPPVANKPLSIMMVAKGTTTSQESIIMARLKTKGMSKSDIVRQYLGRHPKASVSEIVTVLKPYKVSEAVAAKIKYTEGVQGPATPKKKPGRKAAAPAASNNGAAGATKADQIRDTAKSMPKPVRPRDVIAELKKKGVTASSAQVSTVLRGMGMRRRRRKAAAGTAAGGSNSASLNIDDLIASKKLVGQVGSIEKVKEALAALARLS
jgi:hypothetical protein